MKPIKDTNKKTDRYDAAVQKFNNNNPTLDLVQLQVLFENVGGREEKKETNFERILNIEWLRNLLRNNRNDETEQSGNKEEDTSVITLSHVEDFFHNNLERNIEVFEELMHNQATEVLLSNNNTNGPLIPLSDLGNFFRNSLGGNIEVFEELMNNRAVQILLGINGEIPSIDLNDLGSFFRESLSSNIEIFRRIMTDDIMRLLTDDLDNPIIALGDLGNFFHDSLSSNVEAFETVINTPGITGLLGVNPDNIVQITIIELGNYCAQAIKNNILEQALNNRQIAEDPGQQILDEIGVPIVNQEDQPMGEGNNGEDDVILE